MTSLSTEVTADPAGLRTLAAWLRADLATAVDMAEAALAYASADRGDWTGLAADAFRERMSSISKTHRDVASSARTAAAGIDAFATEVEQALDDIATLRAVAGAAGLTVREDAILAPPGPGPVPHPPGAVATPAEVRQYSSDSAARSRALLLSDAFAIANDSMAAVTVRLANASATLDGVRADVEAITVPAIDFAAGAFTSARVEQGLAALRGQARWLLDSADVLEASARAPGAAVFPAQLYDDLDEAARLRAQSVAALDDAARLARAGRIAGPVVGALLTGVSINADMDAGESSEQAVTSNVAGLGASIAAGAATGAILGTVVPGLGNVAGAIIGAGVGTVAGIITSGMVDSFFENGPDVGAAFSNGWNDLVDAGAAVADLAGVGLDAAGEALDAVGDGLSDAWEGLFG